MQQNSGIVEHSFVSGYILQGSLQEFAYFLINFFRGLYHYYFGWLLFWFHASRDGQAVRSEVTGEARRHSPGNPVRRGLGNGDNDWTKVKPRGNIS